MGLHLPTPEGTRPTPATALLNDVQLVALVAAQMATAGSDPTAAVDTAFDLVAAVMVRAGAGRLRDNLKVQQQAMVGGTDS